MEVLQPMLEKFTKAMKSLNENWNKLYKGIVVAVGALNVSLLHIIGIIAVVIGAVVAILSSLLKTWDLLASGLKICGLIRLFYVLMMRIVLGVQ